MELDLAQIIDYATSVGTQAADVVQIIADSGFGSLLLGTLIIVTIVRIVVSRIKGIF